MKILAIETSCDETSVAIVEYGVRVLSSVVASSSNLFYETGGVVPEVAARAQTEYILPVYKKALEQANLLISDIDFIAVTVGPGLIGSLFVGVNFAKTLSLATNIPVIPVNHLVGHIYSVFINTFIGETVQTKSVTFPSIALVVSGGHTDLVLLKNNTTIEYLGGTRDDAVGESFDKVARILNIDTYLGGPKLSKKASEFVGKNILKLPKPLIDTKEIEFSFSGLKTAVFKEKNNYSVAEIAFAFENSVCDVLFNKTQIVVKKYNPKSIILCGGVSANKKLRELFLSSFDSVFIPPLYLCTDNASMIGSAAYYYKKYATTNLSKIQANPSLSLANLY